MASIISVDELADALADTLAVEAADIRQSLDEVLAHAADDLRQLLRAGSPKDTGAYARGWRRRTVVRDGRRVWEVYNAAKPWLTWVIEYGNRSRKGHALIDRSLDKEADKIVADLVSQFRK